MNRIGTNIKRYMKIKDVTADELSDLIGISPDEIQILWEDEVQISPGAIKRIASALEVSIMDILI